MLQKIHDAHVQKETVPFSEIIRQQSHGRWWKPLQVEWLKPAYRTQVGCYIY